MPHNEPRERTPQSPREIELADECIAAAESALASLLPDLAGQLSSSQEASGVAMSIAYRALDKEIPWHTGQVAGGLVHEAQELRWPNWRDGIPLPPRRACPTCEMEMPGYFKSAWQWCPRCGSSLGGAGET